jgi:Flp pilus assembly protein TadG
MRVESNHHSRRIAVRRRGVASVEAAVVLAVLLLPLLLGIWEIGRLVHAQQVVANSAREGARLAAQGRIINATGTPTEIQFATGTPNVNDAVYQSLVTGGLSSLAKTDVTVMFGFTATEAPTLAPTKQPFQGAKNERFRVTVSIPFSKVRWVNIGLISPTTVEYRVDWQMLVDDPFTVNTTLPNW